MPASAVHHLQINKQKKRHTYIHYTCNISRDMHIKKKLNKLLKATFTLSYGHTMLKAPDPVRSPQLSNIWTSQYYGGGPHGNTGCCSSFIFFYFLLFIFVLFLLYLTSLSIILLYIDLILISGGHYNTKLYLPISYFTLLLTHFFLTNASNNMHTSCKFLPSIILYYYL